MLALLPYPKSLCIWSDTSSLEKSTNVQLGRNACNAVFQTHVCSVVRGYILSTSLALLEEAQPEPSWAGPLDQSTFDLALFWSGCCSQRQAPVSALVWHDVHEDPSSLSPSVPEHEALQRLPIIQRFPSRP